VGDSQESSSLQLLGNGVDSAPNPAANTRSRKNTQTESAPNTVTQDETQPFDFQPHLVPQAADRPPSSTPHPTSPYRAAFTGLQSDLVTSFSNFASLKRSSSHLGGPDSKRAKTRETWKRRASGSGAQASAAMEQESEADVEIIVTSPAAQSAARRPRTPFTASLLPSDMRTAETTTPGSDLRRDLFGGGNTNAVTGLLTMSQAFGQTQASPLVNDLKSDPVFDRPSPGEDMRTFSPPKYFPPSSPLQAKGVSSQKDSQLPVAHNQPNDKQEPGRSSQPVGSAVNNPIVVTSDSRTSQDKSLSSQITNLGEVKFASTAPNPTTFPIPATQDDGYHASRHKPSTQQTDRITDSQSALTPERVAISSPVTELHRSTVRRPARHPFSADKLAKLGAETQAAIETSSVPGPPSLHSGDTTSQEQDIVPSSPAAESDSPELGPVSQVIIVGLEDTPTDSEEMASQEVARSTQSYSVRGSGSLKNSADMAGSGKIRSSLARSQSGSGHMLRDSGALGQIASEIGAGTE